MKIQLRRLLGASAALAVVSSGLFLVGGSANALPGGTAAAGPSIMSPTTGNSSSSFTLTPEVVPAYCPGSAATGHRWTTFLIPASSDPATVFHGSDGPVAVGSEFVSPLFSSGQPIVGQNPATTPLGLIPAYPTFDFAAYDTTYRPPAGAYNIGIACEFSGETTKFWSTKLTVTDSLTGGAAQFTYAIGARPAAPVITSVAAGNGSATVTYTHAVSTPTTTGYTVTATPAGAGAAVTATGAGLSIVVPGLINGTTYAFTVVATNTIGNSAPSTATNGTPSVPTAGTQPAPTSFTAVPGATVGTINLSWVAPTGLAPNGYSLAVTPVTSGDPAVTGSPFTIAAGATSFTVPSLPAGVLYNFVLTATYADASAVATPATAQAAAASAQTLQQVIQVEKPNGALILTQRCGVNNALGAEAVDPGFPGFPAVGAIGATSDQVGTSPDIDLTTAGVQPDPGFNDTVGAAGIYPFPTNPVYPTRCFINLGRARLLTSGDLAGRYYAASGALNEVTVVDTREGDLGWTVKGSIPSLNNGGTNARDTFSGNLVGWSPVVSETTDPVIPGEYDQVVTDGADVVPGTTGIGGLALAAGQVLATAAPAAGLGVAVLDARIKVLIPVRNSRGVYQGTLTLNAG